MTAAARYLAVLLLLFSVPAAAQDLSAGPSNDPVFLQRAIEAMKAQREREADLVVYHQARTAMMIAEVDRLRTELSKTKAELEDLKKKQ